jgi:hypothetical protein
MTRCNGPFRGAFRLVLTLVILMMLVVSGLGVRQATGAPVAQEGGCPGEGGAGSFAASDRLAMTYLYYWYEQASLDDPALTLRPPADQPFDWHDPAWHRQQLVDMEYAGIDVALAVYWGDVPEWSVRGLDELAAARGSLLASGAHPPAIALFLDTNLYTTLLPDEPELVDLMQARGQDVLADQVAGFFHRVPSCHWARIDGRPLIFFWRPDTEDGDVLKFDQDTMAGLYERLEERLGVRPYIVRERTWDTYARERGVTLETDDVFGWGAALRGPMFDGNTVAVGPGYDDKLVGGRIGYVRERDHGKGYAADLRTAALSGASWMLLETWNELWEATAIAETIEHGRRYLDTTRHFVALFRELSAERARDGWVDLASGEGIYLHLLADAPQERGWPTDIEGTPGARPLVEESDGAGYFHFALPPRIRPSAPGALAVLVEYWDEGGGGFYLEYDSDDPEAPDEGRFKATEKLELGGSRQWRAHRFELPDASFRHRQYAGYGDFRLRDLPPEGEEAHVFRRVTVYTQDGRRPVLLAPRNLWGIEPGGSVKLRWDPIEGASGYVVQVAPIGDVDPLSHGFEQEDRQRCSGQTGQLRGDVIQAVSTQSSCALADLGQAPPGLYRWRVWGIDGFGRMIGDPSDWGFLLVRP